MTSNLFEVSLCVGMYVYLEVTLRHKFPRNLLKKGVTVFIHLCIHWIWHSTIFLSLPELKSHLKRRFDSIEDTQAGFKSFMTLVLAEFKSFMTLLLSVIDL